MEVLIIIVPVIGIAVFMAWNLFGKYIPYNVIEIIKYITLVISAVMLMFFHSLWNRTIMLIVVLSIMFILVFNSEEFPFHKQMTVWMLEDRRGYIDYVQDVIINIGILILTVNIELALMKYCV